MDYEKKYKDALADMKVIYPNLKGDAKKAVEHAFPELNESEDESIRKALLRCCDDWEKGQFGCMAKEDVPAIRAYLEKQKEQKPVMIQWTGKNLKEVIDFTGKSPQFGKWFKSWEDFENYVHSHDDILKLFCEDGSHYEVPVGAWIVKTPDGYNTPSRFRFIQKPAEWSEEDDACYELILEELEHYKESQLDYSRHFSRLIEWFTHRFKSLHPQPHWKPSEEQMDILDKVYHYLWADRNATADMQDGLGDFIDELKEL